ncbi:MAG: hypothetical protein QOK02_5689 [Mycobacterium sp.]|nr:hypothetical protein [Mycobacterium sp.]
MTVDAGRGTLQPDFHLPRCELHPVPGKTTRETGYRVSIRIAVKIARLGENSKRSARRRARWGPAGNAALSGHGRGVRRVVDRGIGGLRGVTKRHSFGRGFPRCKRETPSWRRGIPLGATANAVGSQRGSNPTFRVFRLGLRAPSRHGNRNLNVPGRKRNLGVSKEAREASTCASWGCLGVTPRRPASQDIEYGAESMRRYA